MSIETLVLQILNKMTTIGKWQQIFYTQLFSVLMICRGKHNFTNLSRYCEYNEATLRSWFARKFDFLAFNRHLIQTLDDEERIIAFDPSYLPKSERSTDGVNRFWSGCANATKWGLEICGFASVGLSTKTALHLIARQTINQYECASLLEFYASLVKEHAEELLLNAQILVADAYFSKNKFIQAVLCQGFVFVGKLASNAALRYRYLGPRTGKRGRPKVYGGVVDKLNPDLNHFTKFYDNTEDKVCAYEGVVHINLLKRFAKCVIVHSNGKKGEAVVNTFFSTDASMNGEKILKCYKLRFQIEFLYRDAKQHMGLSECQARSEEKIHTHVNASLTAVSLAKVAHHLMLPEDERGAFSLSSIKSLYFNENYIQRILCCFGKTPEFDKKSEKYQELRRYGCIAA